jgi:hypothetical protein
MKTKLKRLKNRTKSELRGICSRQLETGKFFANERTPRVDKRRGVENWDREVFFIDVQAGKTSMMNVSTSCKYSNKFNVVAAKCDDDD